MNTTTVDELKSLYVKLGGKLADVQDLNTDAELIDKIEDIVVSVDTPAVILLPEDSSATLFNTNVSNIQNNLQVIDKVLVGNMKYLSTGDIVTSWGAGNFIAVKFVIIDPDITYNDIKVGLNPSAGNGLVTLDSDLNGVFKVSNKDTQKFRVVVTKDGVEQTTDYVLSGLTAETE